MTTAGMKDLILCHRKTIVSEITVACTSNLHYAYAIVAVPKTGTIDRVVVSSWAKTGTCPTFRVGIEGVAATMAPDGTYKASGSGYVDSSAFTSSTCLEVTLGATVSVTAGDLIAITIRYQSGTIDGSNNCTFVVGAKTSDPAGMLMPAVGGNPATSGAWGMPTFALRYNDGTYMDGIGACIPTRAEWNSSSGNIYRGTLFTPTVDCTLSAVRIGQRRAAAADFNIQVYLGSSSSPTVDQAVDVDLFTGSQLAWIEVAIPPTTVSANQACRVIYKPTSTNSQSYFFEFPFYSQTVKEAALGKLTKTVASSPGTWTETAATVPSIFPIVTEFSYTSGGLSGVASA